MMQSLNIPSIKCIVFDYHEYIYFNSPVLLYEFNYFVCYCIMFTHIVVTQIRKCDMRRNKDTLSNRFVK